MLKFLHFIWHTHQWLGYINQTKIKRAKLNESEKCCLNYNEQFDSEFYDIRKWRENIFSARNSLKRWCNYMWQHICRGQVLVGSASKPTWQHMFVHFRFPRHFIILVFNLIVTSFGTLLKIVNLPQGCDLQPSAKFFTNEHIPQWTIRNGFFAYLYKFRCDSIHLDLNIMASFAIWPTNDTNKTNISKRSNNWIFPTTTTIQLITIRNK